MKKNLLPYTCKYLGGCLVATGIVLLGCYLWFDFRIRIPVFAIYSSFLETTMFTTIRTNIAEELILLLFLAGFLFIIFSGEKKERARYRLLRHKAWIYALLSNSVFIFLSILFVYGTGFIVILTINIFSTIIFYLGFFHLLRYKEKTK